jgi:hypothetical protein
MENEDTPDTSESDQVTTNIDSSSSTDAFEKNEEISEYEYSHCRTSVVQQKVMSSTLIVADVSRPVKAHTPDISQMFRVSEESTDSIKLRKEELDIMTNGNNERVSDRADKQNRDRQLEEKGILELMSTHPSDDIYRGKAYYIRHQANTPRYATPQKQHPLNKVDTNRAQRVSTITSNNLPNYKSGRTRITACCSSWRGSTSKRSLNNATEKVSQRRVSPQVIAKSSMPSASNMKRRRHPPAHRFHHLMVPWRPGDHSSTCT